MPGDLLLVNGRIRTMDPANPAVSAVAIRMGRVVYAGDDAGAKAAAAPGSPVDRSGGADRNARVERRPRPPDVCRFRAARSRSLPGAPRRHRRPASPRRARLSPPDRPGRGSSGAATTTPVSPSGGIRPAPISTSSRPITRWCSSACATTSASPTRRRWPGRYHPRHPRSRRRLFDRDEHGEPTGVLRERSARPPSAR